MGFVASTLTLSKAVLLGLGGIDFCVSIVNTCNDKTKNTHDKITRIVQHIFIEAAFVGLVLGWEVLCGYYPPLGLFSAFIASPILGGIAVAIFCGATVISAVVIYCVVKYLSVRFGVYESQHQINLGHKNHLHQD